ncbi:hypothetical protein [Streptosporangium saharense]|uniref:Uncharacterized protein n=1 Tax=Streptosporangium saharense TaxID=1706840 RepID=A0A7W7QN67_9ACTN|nr:hypothetical protein [Streptosporangium saharense]MBB4916121.1 hypothetical protein [Streptosporangium saharense]
MSGTLTVSVVMLERSGRVLVPGGEEEREFLDRARLVAKRMPV